MKYVLIVATLGILAACASQTNDGTGHAPPRQTPTHPLAN